MDLERFAIANFRNLKPSPPSIIVAKAIANEMSRADSNRLRGFCLGVKQYFTEHAGPDKLDAQFSRKSWRGKQPGRILRNPPERRAGRVHTRGLKTGLIDDQHCVCAECSYQDAVLSSLNSAPAPPPGGMDEPTRAFVTRTTRHKLNAGLCPLPRTCALLHALFRCFRRANTEDIQV
jgi:hypothetical protein